MGMRNEQIIESLRALDRHSESVVAMEVLALRAEKALERRRCFGKRSLCFLSLGNGLLAVPIGRALYALVPDMIRKTEDLVTKLDLFCNESIGGCGIVIAAVGENIVVMYVVTDLHGILFLSIKLRPKRTYIQIAAAKPPQLI